MTHIGAAPLHLAHLAPDFVPPGTASVLGDDRLTRMAAQGSREAFGAIFKRHRQGLYRYCRSILANEEDAKDALQNTMLQVLAALPGEEREITLRPWLFRIAHNEAISLLRRRGAHVPIDEVVGAVSQDSDPAVRERLRELMADLAELPSRQRGALIMRELNGLSYREIGEVFATSETGAKQAVYKARVALHEIEEGREMECEAARHSISAEDGRRLRGRKLRAHIRGCNGCRAFHDSIHSRRSDLKALAPPLPAPAAAALLQGILGGGGAGGGGLAGLAGGTAVTTITASTAIKAATALVAAGLGAAGLGVFGDSHDGTSTVPPSPLPSERQSEVGGAHKQRSDETAATLNGNGDSANGDRPGSDAKQDSSSGGSPGDGVAGDPASPGAESPVAPAGSVPPASGAPSKDVSPPTSGTYPGGAGGGPIAVPSVGGSSSAPAGYKPLGVLLGVTQPGLATGSPGLGGIPPGDGGTASG
jgi:RNA polymerase sigma factor (sigma-70 family)